MAQRRLRACCTKFNPEPRALLNIMKPVRGDLARKWYGTANIKTLLHFVTFLQWIQTHPGLHQPVAECVVRLSGVCRCSTNLQSCGGSNISRYLIPMPIYQPHRQTTHARARVETGRTVSQHQNCRHPLSTRVARQCDRDSAGGRVQVIGKK